MVVDRAPLWIDRSLDPMSRQPHGELVGIVHYSIGTRSYFSCGLPCLACKLNANCSGLCSGWRIVSSGASSCYPGSEDTSRSRTLFCHLHFLSPRRLTLCYVVVLLDVLRLRLNRIAVATGTASYYNYTL